MVEIMKTKEAIEKFKKDIKSYMATD